MNITKPSQTLYLTFSEVDMAGKSRRESYFVSVLKRMFPKLQTEKVSAGDSEADLLCATDALRSLGEGLKDAKDVSEKISETVKIKMDPIPQIILENHSENDRDFIIVKVPAG